MKKLLILFLIILFIPFLLYSQEHKITPGVVINSENYKGYLPELKRLFTPGYYATMVKGLENEWITIPIVKNSTILARPALAQWTKKMQGKCKILPGNKLVGWVAGSPFTHPKTGAELAWDIRRTWQGTGDTCTMAGPLILMDKHGNEERSVLFKMGRRPWMGRVEIPPIPEEPENNGVIQYKLYFLVLAPFDVRGFCQLRISYEDVKKDDDCYGWIPALRRIRRLTGKDLTDPILGSDTCLDDFECWQQKISSKLTFKLDNSEFLVPATYSEKPPEPYLKGNCYQVKWEKRPLYILNVYPNDPDYIYSKRVIYVDKEGQTFALFGAHEYDQKGRLWRSLSQIIPSVYPDKHHFGNNIGAGTWWGSTYFDHISGHSSVYDMFPIFDDPECTPGLFSIKGLLKEAR